MSISGLPPLGGFFSKLVIIIAAIQAGYFVFSIVAILVSIVTLAYYLKFLNFTFFGKLDEAWLKIKEVPWAMRLSMIILAIIGIIAGLLIVPLFRPFLESAVNVLLLGNGYKEAVFSALK
jgi:multicomponent Na+:H+ antiporter subunit D